MKIEQVHIVYIKEKFQELYTKKDLVALLNYAKTIFYQNPDIGKPIQLKSLTYYSNPNFAKKRYKQFKIKKKSGGERIISAPVGPLKLIQRCLNLLLNVVFEPHHASTGFIPGKNIVDNAKVHIGKNYVYNIDLKDFFPSIGLHRVKAVLKLPPFSLDGEREPLAFLIANLCCKVINGKPVLPQGAPTSPIITNIVCQRLDRRLHGLAKRFGLTYTRYADDITFSSYHNVYQKEREFLSELCRIIKDQGFDINEEKIRLQKNAYRQEVTGLTVNEKVNVSHRFIRTIRAMLSNWEKKGLEGAVAEFRKHYYQDKGHMRKEDVSFVNVLAGKIQYTGMIRGKEDPIFQNYQKKFISLFGKTILPIVKKKVSLEKILDIWEKVGFDQAMRIVEKQY